MSKRFAVGRQMNSRSITKPKCKEKLELFCLFLVHTWRSHIATLLKSTIGEHLQHDLKSEDCGEEIVKVAEDSAQKFFVRSLLEFFNIAGIDEKKGHMFCLHQILRREKSETCFSFCLYLPVSSAVFILFFIDPFLLLFLFNFLFIDLFLQLFLFYFLLTCFSCCFYFIFY